MFPRSRLLLVWLLLWAALSWLALRPARALVPTLERGFAPLFRVSELAAPLAWFWHRAALASETNAAPRTLLDSLKSTEVRLALARAALPRDPALARASHLVPAEVLGRPSGARDRLSIALPSEAAGIEIGDPVVCGDAYVGRVVEIENFALGRVQVELLTAAQARVGARALAAAASVPAAQPDGASAAPAEASEASARFVAGGLVFARGRARSSQACLALRVPSTRGLVEGAEVRVDERAEGSEAAAARADGFRLGRLRRLSEDDFAIEPALDYESGLYQVVVLAARDCGRGEEGAFAHALGDGRWLRVRPVTLGDPCGLRRGFRIAAGAPEGLVPGCVLWSAGRLIGRIGAVHGGFSDVRLVSDAGVTLTAVAARAGAEPLVLGRLSSLGERARGSVAFEWERPAALAIDWDAPLEVELFTGSGEAGLPAGLALGSALLPVDPEQPVELLRDERASFPFDPADLWARQAEAGQDEP